VFVGGELGIIDADTLVRRIRVSSTLTNTQVIATVPRSRMAETQARGAYDGVISCSFVPEAFLEQFERLTVCTGTPAQALERVYPRFRMGLIAATEQVFGMTLSAQIELVGEPGQTTDETLTTTLLLMAPAERTTAEVTLRLQTAAADARRSTSADLAQGRRTDTTSDAANDEPHVPARRWPWGIGWLLDRLWGHRSEPAGADRVNGFS